MIEILSKTLPMVNKFPLRFEDDVAAIPVSTKSSMIVKSDMLVGSSDIPSGMSTFEAARKAVVSTISDFASKGVRPLGLLVSLGLRRGTTRKEFRELAHGLASASREYSSPIIGGDTNEAKDLVIDVSGFGIAASTGIIRRQGALPGDIIAVTGLFGNSAAGLRLLLSKGRIRSKSDQILKRAVTRPKARLAEGISLARTGIVTSSIDSSDGLAWSLHELARRSNVGIRLDRIPLSSQATEYARKHRLRAVDLALYGGEEYELVLSLKRNSFSLAKRVVPSLFEIGRVVGGSGVRAIMNGKVLLVESRGWEHFG